MQSPAWPFTCHRPPAGSPTAKPPRRSGDAARASRGRRRKCLARPITCAARAARNCRARIASARLPVNGVADLSQARLKSMLSYNRRTGIFLWRIYKRNVWPGTVAGNIDKDGYRLIRIDRKTYRASHLVWFYCRGTLPPAPLQMDHINRRRDDDRLKNLRLATIAQQAMNRKGRRGSSKYRGVSKRKGRWLAVASFGGRSKYIGLFDTEKAAAKAYLAYARPLCGKFLHA